MQVWAAARRAAAAAKGRAAAGEGRERERERERGKVNVGRGRKREEERSTHTHTDTQTHRSSHTHRGHTERKVAEGERQRGRETTGCVLKEGAVVPVLAFVQPGVEAAEGGLALGIRRR